MTSLRKLTTLLFSLTVITFAYAQEENNGLQNFLVDKMRGYTTWLKDSKFDPSDRNEDPINLKTAYDNLWQVNITKCVLTKLRIRGHSNKFMDSQSVLAQGAALSFAITRRTNYQFEGDYDITGTVKTLLGKVIPFSGKGTWSIGTPNAVTEVLTVLFYGETPDDHIDISAEGTIVTFVMPELTMNDVQFNGLWDSAEVYPQASKIKGALQSLFMGHMLLNADKIHPSKALLTDYLKEILAETTLTEINQTTEPPQLRSTTLPPTTTRPPTTGPTTQKPPATTPNNGHNLVGNGVHLIFAQAIAIILTLFRTL